MGTTKSGFCQITTRTLAIRMAREQENEIAQNISQWSLRMVIVVSLGWIQSQWQEAAV